MKHESGPENMVSFSPGWKYCCDYMLSFSPRAKRKFPWVNLLRCENKIDAHARSFFSSGWGNDSDYMDFSWIHVLKVSLRCRCCILLFDCSSFLLWGDWITICALWAKFYTDSGHYIVCRSPNLKNVRLTFSSLDWRREHTQTVTVSLVKSYVTVLNGSRVALNVEFFSTASYLHYLSPDELILVK